MRKFFIIILTLAGLACGSQNETTNPTVTDLGDSKSKVLATEEIVAAAGCMFTFHSGTSEHPYAMTCDEQPNFDQKLQALSDLATQLEFEVKTSPENENDSWNRSRKKYRGSWSYDAELKFVRAEIKKIKEKKEFYNNDQI